MLVMEAGRKLGTHTRTTRRELDTIFWAVEGRPDTGGKLGTHTWTNWCVRSFRVVMKFFMCLCSG